MAIKISGTTVIDNGRGLDNITSLDATTTSTIENAISTDGIAKAFDRTDEQAATIIKSENVSSITDNGTGQFSTAFTNVMADGDYAVVTSSGTMTAGGTVLVTTVTKSSTTTGSYDTVTNKVSDVFRSASDAFDVHKATFGDLA